jgi:hypothetical protein
VNPGAPFVAVNILKKTAESTGRLPPTPMLHTAAREHNVVIEFGEAPAERAKTPVMKSVRLKDNLMSMWVHKTEKGLEGAFEYLRPQISDPTPKTTAPISKPMFCPSLRKGPLKANSLTTGVKMRPVIIYSFADKYRKYTVYSES